MVIGSSKDKIVAAADKRIELYSGRISFFIINLKVVIIPAWVWVLSHFIAGADISVFLIVIGKSGSIIVIAFFSFS